MNTRTENAKRNILIGTINKIIQLGLPFLIRTVIIWKLGAEYLGLGSLFSSILQVLNMAELGFSSAIIFSLYKPLAEKNTEKICALLALYRKIYHFVGMTMLFLGLLLLPFLPHLIKGSYPTDINIYLLYFLYLLNTVISYFAFGYKSVLLTAAQRQDIISGIESILSICKCIIQFFLLVIFKNFYLYVIGYIIYTIFYNIAINIKTNRKFPEYFCKGSIEKKEKKEILKQVGGLAIGKICYTTRNSFDSIVLSIFCGLQDVAIYSNYFYVFTAVSGLLGVVLQSISAGIGDSVARESKEKNYSDFKKFNFYFSWLSGLCSICMLCLYQPFMKFWVGDNLTASFKIAILFSFYFYISQMGQVRSLYNNAAGIWWELKIISLAEIFSNLLLNFILGYFLGMSGIIIATIITVFFFSIILITNCTFKFYFAYRVSEYYIQSFIYFFVIIFVCGITYACCLVVERISKGVLSFVLRGLVCVSLPNICFLILTCLNKYHRSLLQDLISKVKRNVNE